MANSISRSAFAAQLMKQHGVIDVNHLSSEVKEAMARAGVTEAQLRAIAGADGQIKGNEFKALARVVDGFDPNTKGTKIHLKLAGASGALEETPAGTLVQAFLDEVKRNRAQERYKQPGTKPASLQRRLTVANDALIVPQASRKPEVNLKVKGLNQFAYGPSVGIDGERACFHTAVAQAEQYNKKTFGKSAPRLNGSDQVIQIAYAEDREGRLAVDETQAQIGRAYIDKLLDQGYPAVVGVSYADHAYNRDKMSDHFVTIYRRGYDASGRLFYEFKDPGAGGRTGRFYVDQATGKLFKEGDLKGSYVENADYEVTQVRTYRGIE